MIISYDHHVAHKLSGTHGFDDFDFYDCVVSNDFEVSKLIDPGSTLALLGAPRRVSDCAVCAFVATRP